MVNLLDSSDGSFVNGAVIFKAQLVLIHLVVPMTTMSLIYYENIDGAYESIKQVS